MSVTLQPMRVADGIDEEGMLVFNHGQRLLEVLTHLSRHHGDLAGRWYLEEGFGRLDGPNHPTFPDLEVAQQWFDERPGQVSEG